MPGFFKSGTVTVNPVPMPHGSRLLRYKFEWETDATTSIASLNCDFPIDGELYELTSWHQTSGSGTYNVRIYDEFDLDRLRGFGDGLTLNTITSKALSQIVASGSAVFARGLLCYIQQPVFQITHSVTGSQYRGVAFLDLV